jgi:hypothetical protein
MSKASKRKREIKFAVKLSRPDIQFLLDLRWHAAQRLASYREDAAKIEELDQRIASLDKIIISTGQVSVDRYSSGYVAPFQLLPKKSTARGKK